MTTATLDQDTGVLSTSVRDSWNSGFVVEAGFTPTETVDGWELAFRMEGEITNIWNAEIVSRVGDVYVIRSLNYNGNLNAGQTANFGFQVSGNNTAITAADATDPGNPADPVDPGDPGDPVDPTDPTDPAEPGSDSNLTFVVSDNWGSGFKGEFTLQNNTGKTLTDWSISFDAPAFSIGNLWGGIVSQSGNTVTIQSDGWTETLAPGASVTFGFVANGTAPASLQNVSYAPSFQDAPDTPADPGNPDPGDPGPGDPGPGPSDPLPPSTGDGYATDDGGPFGAPDYGAALNLSMQFYYAQYAGDLPDSFPLSWRGDATLTDGADVGRDLSGGWFDAGDHVKFGFPMAYTATTLAWGGIEFEQGYRISGALDDLATHLRHVNDYFLNAYDDKGTADISDDVFHAQVGDGSIDHSFWGAPEDMTMERPTYSIDANNPGSDVAAETAAAMAAASIFFRNQGDTAYADELLEKATSLYAFAETYLGKYSDAVTDAQQFYNSWSGYQDELSWGANWLYQATGDQAYLDKSIAYYSPASPGWAFAWDDKGHGTAVLLAAQTGDAKYTADVAQHFDHWLNDIATTPGTDTNQGLAWLDQWGSNRYAANTAFLAAVHAKELKETGANDGMAEQLGNFAADQIDYMLGDNPDQFSYVVGFGDDFPLNPHHRGASGTTNINDPAPNVHTLNGALVGGPDNQGNYQDNRTDYVKNEVANDYNAGFSGAVAALVEGNTASSGNNDDLGWLL